MRVVKIGLVAAGLFIGSAAMAQGGQGDRKSSGERAENRTERMAQELSLTEEQKAKVTELNAQSMQKRKEIMDDTKLTEDQKKTALKANHDANETQLRAILTPEQQAKLDAKKEERKEQQGDHAGKTPEEKAQFRTNRMASELNLTEDQKKKVYASNLTAAQKEEAIRSEELSEDAKKAAFKELHQAQKDELKAILTKEQLDLLKEKKEEHKGQHEKSKAPAQK